MGTSAAWGPPHILVCDGDQHVAGHLGRWLERAGITYDWAHSVRRARQWLDRYDYDALTVNLLLPDQDGISFMHELHSTGRGLPVLGLSIRGISRRQGLALPLGQTADWLDTASEQARLIFAVKTAVHTMPAFRPHILQVQTDAYAAELTARSLRDCADLTQARTLADLRGRLLRGSFDLILINPDLPDDPEGQAVPMVRAASSDTPVILHSTYRIMDDADDARAAGPVGTAAGLVETIRCFASVDRTPLVAYGKAFRSAGVR
ncbi:MAG: response regulator [Gammaproteobacteria bacterium]